MKLKLVFAMMAAGGLLVVPAFADHHGEEKKAAVEASAEDTVTAYVVAAKGGGWGIAKRVSSALTSLDNVKTVILSGLRATVIMEGDATLDEDEVKSALEAKKAVFASMEKTEVPRPKAVYVLKVSGATWADMNEKARVALEKVEGVSGAYVNNDIVLHLEDEDGFDEKLVASTIEPFKMKVQSSEKSDEMPF